MPEAPGLAITIISTTDSPRKADSTLMAAEAVAEAVAEAAALHFLTLKVSSSELVIKCRSVIKL